MSVMAPTRLAFVFQTALTRIPIFTSLGEETKGRTLEQISKD